MKKITFPMWVTTKAADLYQVGQSNEINGIVYSVAPYSCRQSWDTADAESNKRFEQEVTIEVTVPDENSILQQALYELKERESALNAQFSSDLTNLSRMRDRLLHLTFDGSVTEITGS